MSRTDDNHPLAVRCRKLALAVGWICPPLLLVFARITFHVDNAQPTAYVTLSGKIALNEAFSATLSDKCFAFVLAHEAMHLILRHHARRGSRDPKAWNIAGDQALNQILREGGVGEAPASALFPPRGKEAFTAEELYTTADEDESGKGSGDGDEPAPATAGCGVVVDADDEPAAGDSDAGGAPAAGDGDAGESDKSGSGSSDEPTSADDLDRQWREVAVQVASQCRGTKAGTALAKLFVKPVPRAAWHRVVRSAMAATRAGAGADDYSFDERARLPSLSPRIIMPGTIATKARACVVIDSSGSVSDAMLSAAIKHTVDAARQFDVAVYVVIHDAKVQWEGWIRGVKVSDLVGKMRGRGGTDAKPAYRAIEKLGARFTTLIHLTDGELGEWPTLPANVNKGISALLKPRHAHTSRLPPRFTELLVEVTP